VTISLQAIEVLAPVRAIATTPGLYPALSALHILGVGILVGSIATVDLRLLRLIGSQVDDAVPWLIRFAIGGFVLAAVTGLCLASVRIAAYAQNAAFLAKLILLMIGGTNACLLRLCRHRIQETEDHRVLVGALAGVVSLTVWIATIAAGRWIAFV
jgi:hypothetical protein